MILVAGLLLPGMAVLLCTMSRIEEWLARTAQPPRHTRRRHLHLIPGGRQEVSTRRTNGGTGGLTTIPATPVARARPDGPRPRP
ncbi:hypothetical protein [Streptomyces griseomycini]|uniref:Uncharacterized protein n=1 Tax=Streptomyces griseomycini TaxID=66895 RepID=A0A7W7M1H4_9ACTN|nr:hypothetical protein [Streptomyces griseomycini]MBB4899441.1 hypothetical protein [Streptomyces griseomycini]GGQ32878.1 hypothetical protein GCM10010266_65020 [Streptomyces griseomycini]GGR63250.1 hypothetical protein GCM10015536_78190 [Streptomyces griseomycini]